MQFNDWFMKDQRLNTLSFHFAMYVIAVLSHTKWAYVTALNVSDTEKMPHYFSVADKKVKENEATYTVAIFQEPLTILVQTKDINLLKERMSEEEILADTEDFAETFTRLFENICTIKWKRHGTCDLDLIAVVNDPEHLFEDDTSVAETLKGESHPVRMNLGN